MPQGTRTPTSIERLDAYCKEVGASGGSFFDIQPDPSNPRDPYGLSVFDGLLAGMAPLPDPDWPEEEDKPPIVTVPADYKPGIIQYCLDFLYIAGVRDGELVYSYPHPLPEESWQKPIHIYFDERHYASIQRGRRSKVYFRYEGQGPSGAEGTQEVPF